MSWTVHEGEEQATMEQVGACHETHELASAFAQQLACQRVRGIIWVEDGDGEMVDLWINPSCQPPPIGDVL